ncbi:MAG: bifunctional UDP-N-acetylglucosamine diphosphorylase/glucosamine-1-phosphate N-acetyltransferase GlmU, partial [Clostridiales bacterium]
GSYGRIIRNTAGDVQKIVEARDADEYELAISEVNSGVYCFDRNALQQIIGEIKTNNDQEEYYLTDAVAALREQGEKVSAFVCADQQQISGVNDRSQLAEAARVLQLRKNRQLMLSGVTIVDPQTTYIDSMVTVGLDTVIEPQSYICGNSRIGTNCQIGPMVKIVDSLVGDGGVIGPFAYLRPGTKLGARVKAGHFVEIKNSVVGDGSKVPHLSYIGDAEIGQNVNIGCGVITCNYDGVDKHKTEIGDGAFIGSNSNFIAPVKVGSNCTVAAGSTLTANVPDDALAIARAYQCNIENWAGKNKNSKK